MIENKEQQLMLHELRCREDELACQKNAQLSLEKDIECVKNSIVHVKCKIKHLQEKLDEKIHEKINC